MDGFTQLSGVVVIASTNRPDILDQALTRPGRFDREIAVNLADVRGREAILRVHARKLKLEDGLELDWIARGTPGFSGADLANLLNEAAIAATRDDNAEAIGRSHVEHARDKILMGAERHGFRWRGRALVTPSTSRPRRRRPRREEHRPDPQGLDPAARPRAPASASPCPNATA